jgi:hypothetical protein
MASVWIRQTAGTLGTITFDLGDATPSTSTQLSSVWQRVTGLVSHGTADVPIDFYFSQTGTYEIWGAQLEVGSFATSYIPTTSAQATRAADNAALTGTNFSSWHRQGEGTVLCKYALPALASPYYPSAYYFDNGESDRYGHWVNVGDNNCGFDIIANGAFQSNISVDSNKNAYSQAVAYKLNDIAISVDGATTLTDATANIPVANRLCVGSRMLEAHLNGTIAKLAYYPKRLSNTELQSITTG